MKNDNDDCTIRQLYNFQCPKFLVGRTPANIPIVQCLMTSEHCCGCGCMEQQFTVVWIIIIVTMLVCPHALEPAVTCHLTQEQQKLLFVLSTVISVSAVVNM